MNPTLQVGPYQQRDITQGYSSQQHPYPPHHQRHHPNSPASLGHRDSSDIESHRRGHKSRTHRISENSRSIYTDGFIGATGGGLIGGLLFPGLGTVGGALVGWVGGKDYGKHRKWRKEKRERDQKRWERRYGSDRSRANCWDGRKRSHDRRNNHN